MTEKHGNRFALLMLLLVVSAVSLSCRDFIVSEILRPSALLAWILLRFFVLSVDQSVIWGLSLSLIVFAFFLHLVSIPSDGDQVTGGGGNRYAERLKSWHFYFSADACGESSRRNLRAELVGMMVNLYAARKRVQADFHLFNAFKAKEIAIPEPVYEFLYPTKKRKSGIGLRPLWNRISGGEVREYYRKLEECLLFLETCMETKNDSD